jgi:two-component system sensor histidine kinase DesK
MDEAHPRRDRAGRAVAALVTWAVVCGLTLVTLVGAPAPLAGRLLPAVALQLLYLAAMLAAMQLRYPRTRPARAAFTVQLLSAVALGWLLPLDWLPILTILWLAMAPWFIERRAQVLALVGLMALTWYALQAIVWGEATAAQETLLWTAFHLFAALSALETRSARQARDEVATLNRELVATRHLLEQASRQAERTRIARDLHDLLGHHLTALSIHLQVATHETDGEVRERIKQCHSLARLLLSDLREAVGELREDAGIDLEDALRGLAGHTPELQVSLDLPPSLHVGDVRTARTLLRCVQEALTNTLRHAGAEHCWIRIRTAEGHLRLEIHDDGRLRGPLHPGHGLTGMRERIEALGGQLTLQLRDGGLALTATVPAGHPS